jgi:CRP-like cAMP-binding protein
MPAPQTDLMRGLSQDEADELMALGKSFSTPAGGVLFDIGSPADRVFQVVQGRVTLTLPMQVRGSQEDVLIEERLAGETLGWSGLIPPHRFTLKASVPIDSELIAFSRESLLEHFSGRPHVAFTVTRNVASVTGHRLQVFQAMWLREMQRVLELRYSS